jgi:hypothetical protein
MEGVIVHVIFLAVDIMQHLRALLVLCRKTKATYTQQPLATLMATFSSILVLGAAGVSLLAASLANVLLFHCLARWLFAVAAALRPAGNDPADRLQAIGRVLKHCNHALDQCACRRSTLC